MRKMTEAYAVEKFIEQRLLKKDGAYIDRVTYKGSECDILQVTNDFKTHEYEVKMQLGLTGDLKKMATGEINMNKHDANMQGLRVNYFTYIIPEPQRQSRVLNSLDKRYGLIFIRINMGCIKFLVHRKPSLLRREDITKGEFLAYCKLATRNLFKRMKAVKSVRKYHKK